MFSQVLCKTGCVVYFPVYWWSCLAFAFASSKSSMCVARGGHKRLDFQSKIRLLEFWLSFQLNC